MLAYCLSTGGEEVYVSVPTTTIRFATATSTGYRIPTMAATIISTTTRNVLCSTTDADTRTIANTTTAKATHAQFLGAGRSRGASHRRRGVYRERTLVSTYTDCSHANTRFCPGQCQC